MTKYFLTYFIVLVIFLTIDAVWLGFVARKFYVNNIGFILAEKPNFLAAAVFYSIYVIGIIIFSTIPALKDGLGTTALIYGALFGFFAYLTYDMTNYSTLKDWPLQVSLIDTAWGTFLTGISSYLGYHVAKSWVTF